MFNQINTNGLTETLSSVSLVAIRLNCHFSLCFISLELLKKMENVADDSEVWNLWHDITLVSFETNSGSHGCSELKMHCGPDKKKNAFIPSSWKSWHFKENLPESHSARWSNQKKSVCCPTFNTESLLTWLWRLLFWRHTQMLAYPVCLCMNWPQLPSLGVCVCVYVCVCVCVFHWSI